MFRVFFRLVLLIVLVGPFVFVWAALAPDAILPQSATLSPAQAAQSREVIKRFETAAMSGAEATEVRLSAADLNALIATGARVVRPLRGHAQIDENGVHIALSGRLPVPRSVAEAGLPLWINFDAEFAPAPDGFELSRVRLGRMSLPSGLTEMAVRRGLDVASGGDLGTLLFASVTAMETTPGLARLTLDTGTAGGETLFARLMGGVRDALGLGDGERVAAQYSAMTAAARAGELPTRGSATPWIRHAVARVADAGHETAAEAEADLRAALLALAAHCGDPAAIERVVGDIGLSDNSPCDGTTLAGRADLRKHFTLSAAFDAAGGASVSFGLGEVKELVDAGRDGGSGYSFDDIAADLAGIRFAQTARATPLSDLTALAASLDGESAYLPRIDDLPSRMSEAEFAARFGKVDSDAYTAQLDAIGSRIATLPIHGS